MHFIETYFYRATFWKNHRQTFITRVTTEIGRSDETANELRESDTDEDQQEIAVEEYRTVKPAPQEPVTVPDEDNDGETPNDDPDLMDAMDKDEAEQEGGEGLHNNEVLNENISAQNEATGNDDQL